MSAAEMVTTGVGGQDLVASTLKSFENLIRMREREEVQELREICRPATPPEPAEWPRSEPTLDERVLCVFQGMDFDGNGTIEAEELADLIQNDAVTPLILPLLDNDDGDGKVTPEEFQNKWASNNFNSLNFGFSNSAFWS